MTAAMAPLPPAARAAMLAGLAGGLLFVGGDMLMYGHFGAAGDFPAGARAAVRAMPEARLVAGGLVGPLAAWLCAIGFRAVAGQLAPGIGRRLVSVLASLAMAMLGAVHLLWVARGLAWRECGEVGGACSALAARIDALWRLAYDVGTAPAWLGCALLAVAVLAGRTRWPRWTVVANPALSLLAAPLLVGIPAPWGAPLIGSDANLFLALFFLVAILTARRG